MIALNGNGHGLYMFVLSMFLSEESGAFLDRPLGFANDRYPFPAGFRAGKTRPARVVA
jgi:hypothetical protein